MGVPTVLWIARVAWIAYFVYDAGLFLTKLSVLLFLRRVFPKSHSGNWFNIGLLVAHVINVAWLLGIVFGTIFLCDPIEKSYNPMIPGSCGSTSSLYIGSAVPSIAIDLIILILPLPKLWSLQIDRARKMGLIVVFTFGYWLVTPFMQRKCFFTLIPVFCSVIVMSLGRLITTLRTQEDLNTDFSCEFIFPSLLLSLLPNSNPTKYVLLALTSTKTQQSASCTGYQQNPPSHLWESVCLHCFHWAAIS